MTNISERSIKIQGTANIPKDLEYKSYDLVIKNAERRGVKDEPNDDGTFNRIFTLRISPMSEVNIIDGNDIILAKPRKGSLAQKVRFELLRKWEQGTTGFEDFEDYYTHYMQQILQDIEN